MSKKYLIFFFGIAAYLPLFWAHYQQDEWLLFSSYKLIENRSLIENVYFFLLPQPGQYVPLTQILTFFSYSVFGISYSSFLIIGLLLHFATGLLLYKLINQLTGESTISLLAGLLFVVAPHHFQATAWVVANIGYTLSAICLLLALSFFFKWLATPNWKNGIVVSISLLTSLFFKEITLYVLVLLPLITLIWSKKLRNIIYSLLIAAPGLVFIGWHFWYLKQHPLSNFSVSYAPSVINIVTLPLRALTESILPQHVIYKISTILLLPLPPFSLEKIQTTAFNQQVESIGALSVVLIFCISVLGIFKHIASKKVHEPNDKYILKLFTIGLLLTAFSGVPYLYLDSPQFSLLQPRYVYIGVLFSSFCYAALILFFRKNQWTAKITILMIGVFFIMTFQQSLNLAKEGIQRRAILRGVAENLSTGLDNTVIYVQSDSSFYGLPNDTKVLPFQIGPGKIFALYLQKNVYIPHSVYLPDSLYEIDSQGYYQDQRGSWGYFRTYPDLLRSVQENKIDIDSIYSFDYSSKTQVIKNITSEVRQRLTSDLGS